MSVYSDDSDNVPWNHADADIILRSAQGVDFAVDKIFLVRASRGFEGMFGAAIGTGVQQKVKGGRPIVTLPESTVALEGLLRLIYHSEPPDLSDKATLFELCLVVDKYCFRTQPLPVVVALKTLAEKEPELAYIYACRLGLSDVARYAAKASLRDPKLLDGVPSAELHIEGWLYHAFAMYQRRCLETAMKVVRDVDWMLASTSHPGITTSDWAICNQCVPPWVMFSSTTYRSKQPVLVSPKNRSARISSWMAKYLDLVEAELTKDTRGVVATYKTLIEKSISSTCTKCRTAEVAMQVAAFADTMKGEIERRIALVELEIS